LEGSRAVVAANEKFTATMTNDVRWGSGPAPNLLELRSDTTIQASCSLFAQYLFSGVACSKNAEHIDSFYCAGNWHVKDWLAYGQVVLEVPGWFRVVPLSAIERTGSSVMQRVLDRMVPKFLKQLQADYELWASGDGSRKPIGDGQL